MCCGFSLQDRDGALVRRERGEDLQVSPDKTFYFKFLWWIMSTVSRILGHNLWTCQYCFMFVKNVDGVPSALASFARRPQSTIYLKTINCGGQNLINKCHRWKEWKYVNSRLAFTQPFDVYTTTIEVPILNSIGVLILLIVAEKGKLFWLRFPCLSNSW